MRCLPVVLLLVSLLLNSMGGTVKLCLGGGECSPVPVEDCSDCQHHGVVQKAPDKAPDQGQEAPDDSKVPHEHHHHHLSSQPVTSTDPLDLVIPATLQTKRIRGANSTPPDAPVSGILRPPRS